MLLLCDEGQLLADAQINFLPSIRSLHGIPRQLVKLADVFAIILFDALCRHKWRWRARPGQERGLQQTTRGVADFKRDYLVKCGIAIQIHDLASRLE